MKRARELTFSPERYAFRETSDYMIRQGIIIRTSRDSVAIDLANSSPAVSLSTSLPVLPLSEKRDLVPRTLSLTAIDFTSEPPIYRLIGFSSTLGGGRVLESKIENEQPVGETVWRVGLYRDLGRQVEEHCQSGKEPAADIYLGKIVTQEPNLIKRLHDEVMIKAGELNEYELARLIMLVSAQSGLAFQAECSKA